MNKNCTFSILSKKYQRNLRTKPNTIYFTHNNEKHEIEMLYIEKYNRYAFIQNYNESKQEFLDRMAKMGLGNEEAKNEFLQILNKYSKLGPMKERE